MEKGFDVTLKVKIKTKMKTKETRTPEEMLTHLNNVTATYYECHGHGKAARNEQRMNYLISELTERGIPVPSVDERLKKGSFNGPGSC